MNEFVRRYRLMIDLVRRNSLVFVLIVAAALQVGTGLGMIVQYAKLTHFINCQAAYNEATSDSRDKRLPAQAADQEATAAVIAAAQTRDPATFKKAIDKAVLAHDNYVKVQRDNPYKPPSDFCGPTTRE